MRLVIWLSVCRLLLSTALAQTQPGVAEILQKVSQTYKAASVYELVVDLAESVGDHLKTYLSDLWPANPWLQPGGEFATLNWPLSMLIWPHL
jgi:hypothetical protein